MGRAESGLGALAIMVFASTSIAAQSPSQPQGIYAFGEDQTIADIAKVEWAPLALQGLPPGIEVAVLRGDLAKG
jgi:hypothetical protein